MFMIDVMVLAAPGRFSSISNTTREAGSSCLTGLHRCSHPMDNDGGSQNRPRGFIMPSTRPVMGLGSFLDALDFAIGSTKSSVATLPRQTSGQQLRGGCAGGHRHPRPDAIIAPGAANGINALPHKSNHAFSASSQRACPLQARIVTRMREDPQGLREPQANRAVSAGPLRNNRKVGNPERFDQMTAKSLFR